MDLKLKMVRIVSGNHCSIDTRKEQKRNQRQLVRTFNNLVLYMMTKKKKTLSNKHDWVSKVRLWRWIWFDCITGLQQDQTTTLKSIWCASTRAVTLARQPARLWSKGPGYGVAIFRWGIAAGAEHQSSPSGPAFGDEMISHTASVCTNLSQSSELQRM